MFRQGDRPYMIDASRSLTESTVVESGGRYNLPDKVLPFGSGEFSVLFSPLTANGREVHQPEEGIIHYNRVELFWTVIISKLFELFCTQGKKYVSLFGNLLYVWVRRLYLSFLPFCEITLNLIGHKSQMTNSPILTKDTHENEISSPDLLSIHHLQIETIIHPCVPWLISLLLTLTILCGSQSERLWGHYPIWNGMMWYEQCFTCSFFICNWKCLCTSINYLSKVDRKWKRKEKIEDPKVMYKQMRVRFLFSFFAVWVWEFVLFCQQNDA